MLFVKQKKITKLTVFYKLLVQCSKKKLVVLVGWPSGLCCGSDVGWW